LADGLPGGYEAELAEWRAIVARDGDAFRGWLARYEIRLRVALAGFATLVAVEVVVQRAAMLVWQRTVLIRPDGQHAVEPDGAEDFLYRFAVTVAKNDARSQLRRTERYRHDSLGGPAASHAGESAHELRTKDLDLGENRRLPDPLLRARIEDCLKRLREGLRSAIQARVTDRAGHSDKALAAALGIRYDRFRKHLQRGRESVERCLEKHGIDLREYLR